MSAYFVKTTYFDGTPPDYEEFDDLEDAVQTYDETTKMRCDCGTYEAGDIAEVMYGIVQANGKRIVWNRYAFQ